MNGTENVYFEVAECVRERQRALKPPAKIEALRFFSLSNKACSQPQAALIFTESWLLSQRLNGLAFISYTSTNMYFYEY